DLVAVVIEMAVEAVVGEIEFAVGEPLVEGRVGVVEALRRLLEPGDSRPGLIHPVGLGIGRRLLVDARPGVGLSSELRRRREAAVLGKQVLDRLGHWAPSGLIRSASYVAGQCLAATATPVWPSR